MCFLHKLEIQIGGGRGVMECSDLSQEESSTKRLFDDCNRNY